MSAFTPQFIDVDDTLAAALRASWQHPLDATPLSIAADILDDYGDARARWVRTACNLWEYATRGVLAKTPTTREELLAKLVDYGITQSPERHRVGVMFVAMVLRLAPLHDGHKLCDLWSDVRITQVNHWCLLFSCGLVNPEQSKEVHDVTLSAADTLLVATSNMEQAMRSSLWALNNAAKAASDSTKAAREVAWAIGQASWAAWDVAWVTKTDYDTAAANVWRFASALWAETRRVCSPLVNVEVTT